jgi:putative flavoprotein involved in K+ transport
MTTGHLRARRELSALDGARLPVVVIGGGQAGLSMSWHLCRLGIEHAVIERATVGYEWRERRWDSFCLVTPNWQCQLPGFPYSGPDPDGFMVKDEIVGYLEAYAASFDVPLYEHTAVTRLAPGDVSAYALKLTSGGLTVTVHADNVVLATGGYHVANLPRMAEQLDPAITSIHSSAYKNADQFPAGGVLVVGSGQSGAQIAEDLHLAGRQTHLAVGSAPRVARFYRGRDVVAWLDDLHYYDMPVEKHPLGTGVRRNANHYVTGRDGGRDINLRRFASEGMKLYGHVSTVSGTQLELADDLARNLDRADEVCEGIKDTVDRYIESAGIEAPFEARPQRMWEPPADQARALDLAEAGISTVIWAVGYRREFHWVEVPMFDGKGYPTHTRGVTQHPGLYLLGLPWQHTWGSGRFSGVAADAAYLAERLAWRVSGDLSGRVRTLEAANVA